MCKLDIKTCNYKCVEIEDVSALYKKDVTEKDALKNGYCTLHNCEHNPTGFKCELDRCKFESK